MKSTKHNYRITLSSYLFPLGIALASCGCLAQPISKTSGPANVEVRQDAGRWQLFVDNQPFFINGVGGEGSLSKLKEAGGNSVRTWGIDRLQTVLDEAQLHGVKVCAGIWFHHEHDAEGFDYSKPEMVKAQLQQVRQAVLRFKDHPALLLWGLGNEMEGESGDKVVIWKAVQEAAKLTKELDPNHPTMTVIAEIGGRKIEGINKYCPDIDIVGINSYGGGPSVAERYAKLNCNKPYIITEFGPPGFWEVGKTSWDAPIEPTSNEKSEAYRRAYLGSVYQKPLCLGSYAFLWGNKQERTATWFGMFLPDGVKVSTVDTMTELWSGKSPRAACPAIKELKAEGDTQLKPKQTLKIHLTATDPAKQPLSVRWVVQPEQTKTYTAGREESVLPEIQSAIIRSDENGCEIAAPIAPGGYRVFAYVHNAVGASVGNIPFHVASPPQQVSQDTLKVQPVASKKQ